MLKEESVEHAIVWTDAEVKKCKNWVGFLIWWCTNQQWFLNWWMWEGREGNGCRFWQFVPTSTQASMQNAVIDRSSLGIGMSRVRRFFSAPLTLWPVYIQTRSCMTVQHPINYSHMFPVLICQFLFPCGTVCRDVRITHVQVLFIPFSHDQLSWT